MALKKYGLRVIYKAHPDRINDGINIYKGVADEVNSEKLEDVWHKAKIFLFTSPVSTATGFLAFTNRKMILIDHPRFGWNKGGKEKFEKRCKILNSHLSTNGRINFSEEELYQAVTEHFEISNEFIDQYR